MTDIVERARLVQRVNAHWLDSICDCDECTEERFDLITPMADEIEALRARVKELEAERNTLISVVASARERAEAAEREGDALKELLRVMPGYGLSAYDRERWEQARNAVLEVTK